MNERIRKLRASLGLTQQEFADQLGISRNNIATYEIGKSNPGDSAIILMCKTFGVNERWLRTGEGEMRVKVSADEEIAHFVGEVLSSETPTFRRRLIRVLSRLDDAEWEILEQRLKEILEDDNKDQA